MGPNSYMSAENDVETCSVIFVDGKQIDVVTDNGRHNSLTKHVKSVERLMTKCTNIKENDVLDGLANSSKTRDQTYQRLPESDLKEFLLNDINHGSRHHDKSISQFTLVNSAFDRIYSFPRMYLTSTNNSDDVEPFVLQPSLFHKHGVPPTIYFRTNITGDCKPPIGLPKSLQRFFRWKFSSITPNSIRNCISFMKFDIIRPQNSLEYPFVGCWCKHMPTADFGNLDGCRKVNHYPGSFHIGRKDKLSLRLRAATQKHDDLGLFHPATFVLPKDFEELKDFWKNSPSNLFIMKPPASARGNGIKVINDISQIPDCAVNPPNDGRQNKRSTMIVQQYIANPCLLENGQKFDLRVYVLVTSVDPLRVYVYNEGLVRFASSKYTSQEDGIIDQYMHLTNYFVNKNNQKYRINNDCESLHGGKWTLTRFWRYLREHYPQVDVQNLWDEIIDIIVKTIICCEGPMARLSTLHCRNDYSAYELFGFDIILDEKFKPWILEVNITPSLKSESVLDSKVKYKVIEDMFNLVGYHLIASHEDENPKLDSTFKDLFFKPNLYTSNATKHDKAKHMRYQKLFKLENELCMTAWSSIKEDCDYDPDLEICGRPEDLIENFLVDNCNTKLVATNESQHDGDDFPSNAKLVSSIIGECILNNISQNDVRILMLSEDELSRCGEFQRVFPTSQSKKYLKYFDRPRYYNLLLDAWEQKYHTDRAEGIKRLSALTNHFD